MKEKIHPKYVDAEIRCACGNVIKTRSTKPVIIVGICNACHPFFTGQQVLGGTIGDESVLPQNWAGPGVRGPFGGQRRRVMEEGRLADYLRFFDTRAFVELRAEPVVVVPVT